MRNEKLKESTQLAFENRILAELSLESAPSHSGLYRIFFDVKNETLQNVYPLFLMLLLNHMYIDRLL